MSPTRTAGKVISEEESVVIGRGEPRKPVPRRTQTFWLAGIGIYFLLLIILSAHLMHWFHWGEATSVHETAESSSTTITRRRFEQPVVPERVPADQSGASSALVGALFPVHAATPASATAPRPVMEPTTMPMTPPIERPGVSYAPYATFAPFGTSSMPATVPVRHDSPLMVTSEGTIGQGTPSGGSGQPSLHGDGSIAGATTLVAALARGQGAPGAVRASVGGSELAALAHAMPHRSYTLPKGTSIECVLETRIDSTLAGLTRCIVSHDVYSADGSRRLIEKGSRAVGSYKTELRIGQARLFVLWERIETPDGFIVDLESAAADQLGASGIAAEVDEHWFERIGAAFLLSILEDGVASAQSAHESSSGGSTVVLTNTSQTGDRMAGKVLDHSINIPATLSRGQGASLAIMVARDVDFYAISGHPEK